ncbi:phage terminase large subunit [Hoeflea sp.]|uniref:PBSX family phage terminase large subunit n=1 Tax=Hoeflea sp. TaxID=1940281 RepID=UPI0025C2F87A|nr:phage terminase large subunit [Hoeflea sp.]
MALLPLPRQHQTLVQAQQGAKQWPAMCAYRPKGLHDDMPALEAMQSGLFEYLFLLGGRAGGKSHEVAEAIVELCATTPKRVVCGREFQVSIRDSSRSLLVNKIKAHWSAPEWECLETELRHKNGTLITFIGMARNPESAKSLEGCDIFWGEEAQSFSAASMEILIPTIRESGSMLLFTLNPRYEDDPVYQLAMVDRPDYAFVKVVEFEDNPYLFCSRLVNDLRKAFRSSNRYKHVWRGDLDRNSALLILHHTIRRPPILPGYEHTGRRLYGIDFGGTDPTAFVRLWHFPPQALGRHRDDKGVLYFDREFVQPCRSNREIVAGVKEVCPELAEGRWHVKADSADPKAIGELNEASVPTIGAVKGDGSVLAGLRTLADHDIWISEDCPATGQCAANYRWKADRMGKPTNVPEHQYSHPFDASRYAIEDEDFSGSDGVSYIILGEAS